MTVIITYLTSINLILQFIFNGLQLFFSFTSYIEPQTVTPYMLIALEFILLLSQIALITQMYEWLTIYCIITFQKHKSLGEIMYKLNTKGIHTFRMLEVVNFVIYLTLVVIMFVLKGIGDYYWLESPTYILRHGTKQFTFIALTDYIPSVLLIAIFSALVYQMRHYHYFEW